jgi:hypothetical protein
MPFRHSVLAALVALCLVAAGTTTSAQTVAAAPGDVNAALTPPIAFVAISPCRLADTRGNGFTGPFGPPAMAAVTPRVFPVAGHCGIPLSAQAVSANMAVTNTSGVGFISVWPEGAPQPSPLVASMNFSAGQTIANAVIAPLGGTGGINVYARVGLDLIIDVNGYFDTGAAGPTGPQGATGPNGATGPQGPAGAPPTLANQVCSGLQAARGFDANGNIVCVDTNVATFSGVQVNTPISALVGWTLCYIDTYDNGSTTLASILGACNGNNLLLACRVAGSPTLTTFAHAPSGDVLHELGTPDIGLTHPANGVGWYFMNNFAWGYIPAGENVIRSPCDVAAPANGNRLCWNLGGGNIKGGYRCGSNTGLNSSTAFERLIFKAN